MKYVDEWAVRIRKFFRRNLENVSGYVAVVVIFGLLIASFTSRYYPAFTKCLAIVLSLCITIWGATGAFGRKIVFGRDKQITLHGTRAMVAGALMVFLSLGLVALMLMYN
jgi:hypothetical protein